MHLTDKSNAQDVVEQSLTIFPGSFIFFRGIFDHYGRYPPAYMLGLYNWTLHYDYPSASPVIDRKNVMVALQKDEVLCNIDLS